MCLFASRIGFAGDTTEAVLPTSGTKIVELNMLPDDTSYLIMDSPSSGTWRFSSYGFPGLAFDCYPSDMMDPPPIFVYTYWTDNSVPNDTWHYWGGGGALCWPSSFWWTDLYSGSSSISYKFEYVNYDSTAGFPVKAKFVKR